MVPPGLPSAASRALAKVPEWAGRFLRCWIAWFWRLSTVGKILATVTEIVLLDLACAELGLSGAERSSIMSIAGLFLMFLLLPGTLFGGAIQRGGFREPAAAPRGRCGARRSG